MAGMLATKPSVFRFADVTVREREFAIVKAGQVQQVEPKAFRVLLILIRNPNKLITKEELLNSVWEDTAVTENSLARNISLLRRALGDDPHEPRFIETVSSIGYRFVCPVEAFEDREDNANERDGYETLSPNGRGGVTATGDSGPGATSGRTVESEPVALAAPPVAVSPTPRLQMRQRNWLLVGAAVATLVLASGVWYLHRPLPPPRIIAYRQITHDGRDKWPVGTDGSRLYFSWEPAPVGQVDLLGGESVPVPVAIANIAFVEDVSPDGANLLVSSNEQGVIDDRPQWNARVLGGSIRRMPNAASAAFSPDGNTVAYSTHEGDIWLVQSDGSGARKLASVGGVAWRLTWSPDGSAIRFTRDNRLWQISSNGSNLRPLLPGWRGSQNQCCGRWTPDGRFFLFLSGFSEQPNPASEKDRQIWALDERRSLFRRQPQPVQLTTGPIKWDWLVPGKDGKTIFAEDIIHRGELSRFDARTRRFEPFLGGISAGYVSFSREGRYIAYVSYPEGILWKANRDGTNPVQLTDPPLQAFYPRWSPDGSQIAFTGWPDQGNAMVYVVSAEGGSPRRLLPQDNRSEGDPNWSADGRKIVFCSAPAPGLGAKSELRILDLESHQATTVAGSDGICSPRWSPDGRFIAALSSNGLGLKVFDTESQQWLTLWDRQFIGYPAWSKDSRWIYFVLNSDDTAVLRIPVSGARQSASPI